MAGTCPTRIPDPRPGAVWLFAFALVVCATSASAARLAITNARILPVSAAPIARGTVVVTDGKITAVGPNVAIPADARRIDAAGRVVTPGLVEAHSHLGVYALPGSDANADGNEMSGPIQPGLRAIDAVDADDPAMRDAWLGGVTTVQILPGSANHMGGQSAILKLARGGLDAKWVRDAPPGLKMAFGENPKRIYGSKGQAPMTRMGSLVLLRAAFAKAQAYRVALERYAAASAAHAARVQAARDGKSGADADNAAAAVGPAPVAPTRDLHSEALLTLMGGPARLHVHSYKDEDFAALFRLADAFGFRVAAVHHALDAWRTPQVFIDRDVTVVTFADMWGFKHEAANASWNAPAALDAAGVRVALHTDHPVLPQQDLIVEARKAVRNGMRAESALRAVTLNPAIAIGMADRVGSIAVGKDADLVLWSGDPIATHAKTDMVIIDGAITYDRAHLQPGDPTP